MVGKYGRHLLTIVTKREFMTINIEISEIEIKQLIYNELERLLGEIKLDKTQVNIMVKSKQNFKSEWEHSDFKATYIANV